MIFKDADAAGLEPDARLTAMWLWTLEPDPLPPTGTEQPSENNEEEAEDEMKTEEKPIEGGGFALEFDAARKIAQGLGRRPGKLRSVVEVKGQDGPAPVQWPSGPVPPRQGNRPAHGHVSRAHRGSKRPRPAFFRGMEDAQEAAKSEASEVCSTMTSSGASQPRTTTLDRIHQAMLLFARGRSDAVKRFLVDDGIGKDARFWKLAQSLSALYPPGTDEKRWVDGVLARKKGLGL